MESSAWLLMHSGKLSQDAFCGVAGISDHEVFDTHGALCGYHPDSVPLARKTLRNMSYALKTFTRWMGENRGSETREIHTIPPAELDAYLEAFYGTVKKPDGSDYSYNCLKALKTHLGRHLKDKNYPLNIVNDIEFFNSQASLKARLLELKQKDDVL